MASLETESCVEFIGEIIASVVNLVILGFLKPLSLEDGFFPDNSLLLLPVQVERRDQYVPLFCRYRQVLPDQRDAGW